MTPGHRRLLGLPTILVAVLIAGTVLVLVQDRQPDSGSGLSHSNHPVASISTRDSFAAGTVNENNGKRIDNDTADSVPQRQENSEQPIRESRDVLHRLVVELGLGNNADLDAIERLIGMIASRPTESLRGLHDILAADVGVDDPSVRLTLLDILLSLDDPDVEWVAHDLLLMFPSVDETCRLGRFLQDRWQGKYAESIQEASRFALSTTNPGSAVPGSLFQLLGETGDLQTVDILAELPKHQEAYANVALALLRDGSGIPGLEQTARSMADGIQVMQGRLAIELLAFQAHQQETAANSLVDLAMSGMIPADIWPHVMELAAGNWSITLEQPLRGRLDTHTIFLPEGNQVIYRVASGHVPTQEEWDIRQQLLDRLLPFAPG